MVNKEDLDRFFKAAMAAVCHCYDHTQGLYPDNCGCNEREKVNESIKLLIDEHKLITKKLD